MKIISWNVNGIRAAWVHGLSKFVSESKADIYAFQETKLQAPLSCLKPDGYYAFWSFCRRSRGYSGTLTLSRWKPVAVSCDFSVPAAEGKRVPELLTAETLFGAKFDCEGRIITLEFEKLYLVNVYYPNSQGRKSRYDYRDEWDQRLYEYLQVLRKKKMTVVCGDFNVTASDLDIYDGNQKAERLKTGFQTLERDHFRKLMHDGFADSWRVMHPKERVYSWWSNRLNKRSENKGWRIDYMLVTRKDMDRVTGTDIHTDVMGSDHCPVELRLEVEMSETAASRKKKPRFTEVQSATPGQMHFLRRNFKRLDLTDLWEQVDWEKAEQNVAGMQASLARAAYTGNRRRITACQNRIIGSLDAKLLAVRHVCSTSGGSGVDGVIWTTPQEKMEAVLSLTPEEYHADPSRLLLVKSKKGRQRKIHIGSYYDRAMQSLYSLALDPVAESWGDRKSFAFRKGRSALDMNEYIRLAFSENDYDGTANPSAGGENPPQWAFVADIRQCYEHISHEWILKNIPMDRKVLKEFLTAGYMFAGELFPGEVGIGIGLALSPIIANMTLDGLQHFIYKKLYPKGQKIDYSNGNLMRYADDILVTARTPEDAQRIADAIREFLRPRGLQLSEAKSRVVNISVGFDFMSRTYIRHENHVYIYPSEQAVNRFKHSLKETVEGHTGSQQSLIVKLNRKLDGWATYHKTDDAGDAFRQIDVYLKALLLELCEHKHPKWNRKKLLEKYWYLDAFGRYVYALPDKKEVAVKFLGDVLLIQHNRVRTNFNPYIDVNYVKNRTENRAEQNVTGMYRSIWNRQDGKCYYCGRRILQDQEKCLVEVDGRQRKKAMRLAYIHTRCLQGSIAYVDTDTLPETAIETMELLEHFKNETAPAGQKFLRLSEFFCACNKSSVTMTFQEMEEILGVKLGKSKYDKSYWYRTGFMNISQSWLDNGYQIYRLNIPKEKVTFHLVRKETQGLKIPDVLVNQRIPTEAKYELENYFSYIIKKYGL